MTRYFHLLETRNRFANDDFWRGRGGMSLSITTLVVAATLVVVLAAAGVEAADDRWGSTLAFRSDILS
jgi:hypothetical protein